MINNFKKISELLKWDSDDEFYFIQILQRKKDNPGGIHGSNNSSRLIKAYYITSLEHLDSFKDEMIFFATYFNARVCINLNRRSFYKTSFNTLKGITDHMINRNFKDVRRSWNSACGIHNSDTDKIWIVDIDEQIIDSAILECIDYECSPLTDTSKLIMIVPSKSGHHLLTKPFNVETFKRRYPTIDIQKNNPTNLFIP